MPVSDDVLRLGSGRRVGYRLLGADTRPALLYMHRTPSSRAEVGDYEPGLLEELGVCAVAVDRPGYGATDPLDDLALLARTQDSVAVAGRLGMAQFAVQGTSGGGPYALACAALMPGRVQAVILISAGGCIGGPGGLDDMPESIARFGGQRGLELGAANRVVTFRHWQAAYLRHLTELRANIFRSLSRRRAIPRAGLA